MKKAISILTTVTAVAGGKFQIEIAEVIRPASVAALLNEGDDRFTQGKPRRAWQAASAESLMNHFGIDVTGMNEKDTKEVNITNPSINGQVLRVQVREFTETEVLANRAAAEKNGNKTESFDYLLNNKQKRAKSITTGEDEKRYLVKNGELIYSTTQIALEEAKHKLVSHDGFINESEFDFQEKAVAALQGVN
jgi:hypothetical protein